MDRGYQTLDLIEEIVLNNGEHYYEVSNIFLNGIAEYAANKNLISSVRIVKLNIFHSKDVEKYEDYVNKECIIPDYDLKEWIIWIKKDPKISSIFQRILRSNYVY